MKEDPSYNEIIEGGEFTKTVDGYRKQYIRMNDVFDDIGWMLGRSARIGTRVNDDSDYWVFETDQVGETPAFWVLYKYLPEKSHVYLLNIKAVHLSQDE